ncbi:uncharacterized protein JCM10292_004853 [Rhodotorula paludigena]|uniref:uncharacterized protein n=1 Tax=Rhodotorula paludigena TaxID=86838 RepID=UPI0031799A14
MAPLAHTLTRQLAAAARTIAVRSTPIAAASVTPRAFTANGFHTSIRSYAPASKPVEEQSAQHPGRSDIDHLENPSLSEEVVHAEREAVDPLHDSVGQTAHKMSDKVQNAAHSVAESVKNAASTLTGSGGQKRSYHASAVRRQNPEGSKPVEEQSANHPGKSGHDHLDNPSMAEENVHADRTQKDPLPDSHKSSTKKEKASKSAGVKDNVSELKQPGKKVDDLSDGDATRRSMESASSSFPSARVGPGEAQVELELTFAVFHPQA